jgi:hypothetical protein
VLYSFPSGLILSTAFLAVTAFAQTASPVSAPIPLPAVAAPDQPVPDKPAPDQPKGIQPDLSDPSVIHARQNVERVRGLVGQGVLPPNEFVKAQDDLNDALDMSIMRYGALTNDLMPEQADQMVTVAERLFLRKQKRAIQNAQLVASGIIARTEAENAASEVISAKLDLDLAIERAQLVKEFALQKARAETETEAENHPEWNGKVYTRFDGNGIFTRADFSKISSAYLAAFGRLIPVSADGQTAVHTALGFNHAGRIDIALNPDQPEGAWLIRYLEKNRIPFYAFRAAVAHKATGAHIHLGPGSTRLSASAKLKSCCGS